MKFLRKCPLVKRRRQQHLLTCFFGLILLCALLKLLYPIESTNETPAPPVSLCQCSGSSLVTHPHGECFFDHLICYPGYVGHRCEVALTNEVNHFDRLEDDENESLVFSRTDRTALVMSMKRFGTTSRLSN